MARSVSVSIINAKIERLSLNEINKAAGCKETSPFRRFYDKLIYKTFGDFDIQWNMTCAMINQTEGRYLIYILFTFTKFSLLIFINSVALKTQFTSKWTESDIINENFQVTQAQSMIGDYNSPEQSISPRPWEVRFHTQHYEILSQVLLMANKLKIFSNVSPL